MTGFQANKINIFNTNFTLKPEQVTNLQITLEESNTNIGSGTNSVDTKKRNKRTVTLKSFIPSPAKIKEENEEKSIKL